MPGVIDPQLDVAFQGPPRHGVTLQQPPGPVVAQGLSDEINGLASGQPGEIGGGEQDAELALFVEEEKRKNRC